MNHHHDLLLANTELYALVHMSHEGSAMPVAVDDDDRDPYLEYLMDLIDIIETVPPGSKPPLPVYVLFRTIWLCIIL